MFCFFVFFCFFFFVLSSSSSVRSFVFDLYAVRHDKLILSISIFFSDELLPPIPTGKIFQTTHDFCNRWAPQVAPKAWCHHCMAWRCHGNFLQDLSPGAAKFCRGSWRHIGGRYLWLYFSRLITEQDSFKKMGNFMNYVMYHHPLLQGNLLNSTPTW